MSTFECPNVGLYLPKIIKASDVMRHPSDVTVRPRTWHGLTSGGFDMDSQLLYHREKECAARVEGFRKHQEAPGVWVDVVDYFRVVDGTKFSRKILSDWSGFDIIDLTSIDWATLAGKPKGL